MVAYSFNKRFIDPIRVGLSRVSLSFDCPPKRQTIRAIGKRRHARPGEALQLYYAQRTRQCFKIGDARCVNAVDIRIHVNGGRIAISPGTRFEMVYDKPAQLDDFAQADGFADWSDMQVFWREEHGDLARLGPFVGVLVLWEPLP